MHKRRKFSEKERGFIANRANGCCEYCLTRYDFSAETFEIEHIIPLALDGTNELSNLAFSCGGCNNKKRQKFFATDPISLITSPLYNPRIDNWQDHFAWNTDFSIIEGLSVIGRATVRFADTLRFGRQKWTISGSGGQERDFQQGEGLYLYNLTQAKRSKNIKKKPK